MKTIKDLEKIYEIDFKKIIKEINKNNYGYILLQFPEGLKPYATTIVDLLEKKSNAKFLIWMGDCFGACDTPLLSKSLEKKIDLIIQIGHNEMMPNY